MFKTYKDAATFVKLLGYRQYNNVAWTSFDEKTVARIQRANGQHVITFVMFCETALKETG